ncbi:choice-of-anchor J domain-containing protein [Chloroflexota bacterium]
MKIKTGIIVFLIVIFVLISTLLITQPGFFKGIYPPLFPTPTVPEIPEVISSQIKAAIRDAISTHKEDTLVYLLFENQIDNIKLSQDGEWATAWLNPVDPESGHIIPTEPGLVVLKYDGKSWQATLPSDPEWSSMVIAVPDDVLPQDAKEYWLERGIIPTEAATAYGPYGGYYLPWVGGESLYLTQSVEHDAYTSSGNAHYAFDFAMGGYPSGMFDIHAAKGGTVHRVVWSNSNGNSSYANFLVLEDTSTEPTTYQLYLHLAKDSIPPDLRVKGAYVVQGQFIGVADDTGVSSGNHLHFHVHTNPDSYWGRSADITFEDVDINGGRPRISGDLPYCKNDEEFQDVCDETRYSYISGNYINPDTVPPNGDLVSPPHGTVINSDTIRMEGWASDSDSGIKSAQFIANFEGEWRPVSNIFNTSQFSADWNLCENQVPDGPISLALEIRDNVNNQAPGLPGLRHIIKDYECPLQPQTCEPADDEIALFAGPDYRGECITLGMGSHTTPETWGDLGNNNAESIQVGGNVQATLYLKRSLSDRGETFVSNDSNLSDNLIGANTLSSIKIQSRQTSPGIPILIGPNYSAVQYENDTFSFSWDNAGGGLEYQVLIEKDGSESILTPWLGEPFWHTNSLPPGTYTWQARARNGYSESGWSNYRYLYIRTADPGAVTVTAPYTDDMETTPTEWTHSGNWDLTTDENHTLGGSISWMYDVSSGNGYDTGSPNSGYLTSPLIQLPDNGAYYLRFWYNYETESQGLYWDQRLVQISADGAPFENILQLSDDVPNTWLQSPAIHLSAYAGQSIRVRFYFTTLDDKFNVYKGWYIDDFSVTSSPPPNCEDAEDTPANATAIGYGSSIDGEICPGGDIDFYKFQGSAGDQIGAVVDAQVLGSNLDPYLILIDEDGKSVLAENDDQITSRRTDSFVSYRLQRDGIYYLKIKSWEHPTRGGDDQFYTLRLYEESEKPSAEFVYPVDGQPIPPGTITLKVAADDTISGISHVQFFWHSPDWQNSEWIVLGEDWEGQDGWNYIFTGEEIPDGFFARAYDWAGNITGTGVWNYQAPIIYLPVIYAGQ